MRKLKWRYGISTDGSGFFWDGNEQKKSEATQSRLNSPAVFAATYMANPINKENAIFVDTDFILYDPPRYLDAGIVDPEVKAFVKQGAYVVQAWDTAFSASALSDYTVCVTGLFIPCDRYHCEEDPAVQGPCQQHFDVKILHVYREKLAWAEVAPAIRTQAKIWDPAEILVENKAYGVSAIESLESTLPIIAVQPTASKRSRAVEGEGAGSTQGWFRAHRVSLPDGAVWLDDFVAEMISFSGARGAKDDQVDACVHLISHAIRSGSSTGLVPSGWETEEKIDQKMLADPADKINPLFSLQNWTRETLHEEGLVDDPFEFTCSRCKKYDEFQSLCTLKGRKFSAIAEACESFQALSEDYDFKG